MKPTSTGARPPRRLRLRLPTQPSAEPVMDEHDELPAEVVDVMTGQLRDRRSRRR